MSSHPTTSHPPKAALDLGSLSPVARAARRAARRLAWNRVFEFLALWSLLPLLLAVGALTYVKLARDASLWGTFLWGLAAVVVAVLLGAVGAGRRAAREDDGALALDRHHRLEDRLTTALSFQRSLRGFQRSLRGFEGSPQAPESSAAEPAVAPDPLQRSLMELAIRDAMSHAVGLDPRRAVPLKWPSQWQMPALLVVGLALLGAMEVRQAPLLVPEPAPLADRVELFEDDVELLREVGRELEQISETPEALADIRQFNRLVEDVASQRVDRREAFARLEALEREIRGSALEVESLEKGLSEVARGLEQAPLSQPAGEALADKRLADAEEALRQLAERLRRKDTPPTKAELDQLRKALEKATEASQDRKAQADAERQNLDAERNRLEAERKRLLDKKKAGTANASDLGKLQRTERQLERLGRNNQKQQGAAEQLSELDKQLAEAARELAEAQGKASEFMDQSAEAVKKMKQKQLSQKEKEQLLERMREMRDMLRQQKGGEQQREWAERMRKLQRRAQGAGAEGQEEGDPKSRSGRPGGRQAGGVTMGADGQPIPMASQGQKQGAGQTPGSEPGDQPGGTGPQPGEGHNEAVRGEQPSSADGKTQDVMAVAPDTGEGAASSEVIYSAAQRGFSNKEYSRIYTDYKNVAEEVIERESVPPGYRSHVRRYFQLIRPRD